MTSSSGTYLKASGCPDSTPLNVQELEVIDGTSNVIKTTIPYPTVASFTPLTPTVVVNEKTNTVYVSGGMGSTTVTAVSGQQKCIVASVTVQALTGSIAIDPVANLVYLAAGNQAGYGVTILNGTTNAVDGGLALGQTAVSPAGEMAAGLAVNSTAHQLYVAKSGFGFQVMATQ